jgi:hypothetical protein
MDLAVTVGIGAAALGIAALLSVFALWSSLRRWRARCMSLESAFAALRRDLELAASISARAGQQVKRIEQQFGLSRSEAELVSRLHGRKRA